MRPASGETNVPDQEDETLSQRTSATFVSLCCFICSESHCVALSVRETSNRATSLCFMCVTIHDYDVVISNASSK